MLKTLVSGGVSASSSAKEIVVAVEARRPQLRCDSSCFKMTSCRVQTVFVLLVAILCLLPTSVSGQLIVQRKRSKEH